MSYIDDEFLELSNGEYNGYRVQFWLQAVINTLDKLEIGSICEVSNNNYESIQCCVKALKFLYNYLDLCLYDDGCKNDFEDFF